MRFRTKHFFLLLILVIVISYGQMLFMYIWKDDNAIFFKFDHLAEPAGYLGRGLFGEGPYRFSVMPYWYIYRLFGTQSLIPYYSLTIAFYFLATTSVYFLFKTIAGERPGRWAAFLFAAGYIASEGFLWLASSMILSVSIILTCLTLIAYYSYLHNRRLKYYMLAVGLYFLCVFITPVRTHYVLALIFLADLVWRFPGMSFKKLFELVIRLVPFVYIFYQSFVIGADSRTFEGAAIFPRLLSGDFSVLYSFFGTLGYLFVPDRVFSLFTNTFPYVFATHTRELVLTLLLTAFSLILFWRLTKKPKAAWTVLYIALMGAWIFISRRIALSPQVSIFNGSITLVFLGGWILILTLFAILFSVRKIRKLGIFLLGFLTLSLFAYTSYIPTSLYSSVDRYLGHTFVAVVGLLALISVAAYKTKYQPLVIAALSLLGITNIINSTLYQHEILQQRSIPAREFHQSLKAQLPAIQKGDILYFDVADERRDHYASAFSVGQMPETTALAWRYGVDRYDFQLFTDYGQLISYLKDHRDSLYQLYSYFYSQDGLIDTTQDIRSRLSSLMRITTKIRANTILETPIPSVIENKLTIELKATPTFSTSTKQIGNPIYNDLVLRSRAFQYQTAVANIRGSSQVSSSSEWQDRITKNALDGNPESVWQADRVLWQKGEEYLTIKLQSPMSVSYFVWKNGFSNNTPTDYEISTSLNGEEWREVVKKSEVRRLEPTEVQAIPIDHDGAVQYIRLKIYKTLGGDSPAISEIWVVPNEYRDLQIKELEQFLIQPFEYVSGEKAFNDTLELMKFEGYVTVSWKTNKSAQYKTHYAARIPVRFDAKFHKYSVTIPGGGQYLTEISLSNSQIPGSFEIKEVVAENQELANILNEKKQ